MPISDMNGNNGKMSISDMLKKIREQVERDVEPAPVPAIEPVSQVEEEAEKVEVPAAQVDLPEQISLFDAAMEAEIEVEAETTVDVEADVEAEPEIEVRTEVAVDLAVEVDPEIEMQVEPERTVEETSELEQLFAVPETTLEEEEPVVIEAVVEEEEIIAPVPVSASGRYKFRITKKKDAAEQDGITGLSPETEADEAVLTPKPRLLAESVEEVREEDTAETAAVTVLTDAKPDMTVLDGDTRPIEPVKTEEEATLEFSPVDAPADTESALRSWLGTREGEEEFTLHGAERHLHDTGEISYVFDERTQEEETVEEEELVPPEVDETDVNLMIAFGMDDELAQTIEPDMRDKVEKEISEMERKMRRKAPDFEYTSASQNKEIFAGYKKRYRKVTLKIAICALLLLISFLYENIQAFGGTLADAINPEVYPPVIHCMIDLQLVVLGGVLIRRRLLSGLGSLVTLKPTPDSIVSVLFLFTLAYDIGMCFMPVGSSIYMYGFPMLLGIMLSLIFELFNLRREIFSFNIVASKRIKFTIGRLDAQGAQLEQEAFREFLPDDPYIFKLNKASFIDGFYDKMRPSGNNTRILTILIFFSVAIALAMMALGTVWTGTVLSGVVIGYAALMLGMPLATFLTYSLPFHRASQIAYEQDSAILGEEAIDEYADASSISFDDRDVFPSYGVKVRSIKVFGSNRIDSIIYHAASVFRLTGGPLADVFDIATAELGHSEDVRLLSVDTDGIEAVVSGTHLYFGKDEYLRRNRFTPLVDDDDGKVGNASIMYMVSDDEVVAKMYITYRIDPDFEKTLKQLYRYGICVGIKTLDPNIDDEMLSRRIKLDKYPVRILKCREAEDNTKVMEHTDSALVSKNSAKALLKAFTLCAKVQRQIRTDVTLNIIAMLVGTLILFVTLIFGGADKIPSVYVALYQLFWVVPMYLMARLSI